MQARSTTREDRPSWTDRDPAGTGVPLRAGRPVPGSSARRPPDPRPHDRERSGRLPAASARAILGFAALAVLVPFGVDALAQSLARSLADGPPTPGGPIDLLTRWLVLTADHPVRLGLAAVLIAAARVWPGANG